VPITTHAGHWLQNHLHNDFGHTDPRILHDLVWRVADGADERAFRCG
jgi:hypothetical protein